jgi:LPXTG-motif cell wall-anchored protein
VPPASASTVAHPPAQSPAPTSAHQGTARQARPQVTYLPPPSGPNWGLVVVGLIFGLVGAGVVANQVTGFQVADLSELGPSVLVVVGLACALLGLIGIVTRRRRG